MSLADLHHAIVWLYSDEYFILIIHSCEISMGMMRIRTMSTFQWSIPGYFWFFTSDFWFLFFISDFCHLINTSILGYHISDFWFFTSDFRFFIFHFWFLPSDKYIHPGISYFPRLFARPELFMWHGYPPDFYLFHGSQFSKLNKIFHLSFNVKTLQITQAKTMTFRPKWDRKVLFNLVLCPGTYLWFYKKWSEI